MGQAVAIIGTGQTECGKRTDVSYPELIYEAVSRAFEDSGLVPDDVEAVVSGSMPPAMEGVNNPHLYWTDAMGARGKPLIRIATCGSTGISLAHTGFYHVASGLFDLVLVVGAEKMYEGDPQGTMATVADPFFQRPFLAGAPGIFSLQSNEWAHRYGLDEKRVRMAAAQLSVRNHIDALINPYAHIKVEITLEDVLNSRVIAYPVRILDVCPASDGACALIMASERMVKKLGVKKPAWIRGVGYCGEEAFFGEGDKVVWQSAINAATSGQTVYVGTGTYDEQLSMKAGVDLVGQSSTNTIIDVGTGYTAAVYFNGVSDAKLSGFKLRGYAAVDCNNCSPTIEANSIYNSEFGIYGYGSNPKIKDNSIANCTYGIMLYNYSNPCIRSPYGHNTISGSGQGVRCITHSEPKLGTTTYWGNNNITTTGYDIYATSDSPPIYAQNNYWGGGAPDSVYAPNGLVYSPYLGSPAKVIASVAPSTDSEPGPFDENPAATEEYERGLQLYISDRYEEAVPHFKAVIERYPDLKVAQFSLDKLIFAYREMGNEEIGLAYLEDVAAKYSNTPLGDAALRASVLVLSRLGLGEKALARVSDLLERFKGTKWERDLLFEKGMIYKHDLGDQQTATEVFGDFVQRYPDDLVSEFAKLELGYDPTRPGREKAGEQGIEGVCLSQNNPNPFNARTVISFALPKSAFVKLEVYNTLGQKVRTLIETGMKPGNHSVIWNGEDSSGREVSSGTYFCCLKTGENTLKVRKMLLLK